MYLKTKKSFYYFPYTVFSFNIVLYRLEIACYSMNSLIILNPWEQSFSDTNFVGDISDYTSFLLNLSKSKIFIHALSVQKRYISMVEKQMT